MCISVEKNKLSKLINMVANAKRTKVLTIFYVVSFFLGLILKIINNDFMNYLGFIFLFNSANGFLSISCFKSLNINKIFKLCLFVIYISFEILLYKNFFKTNITNDFFGFSCVFVSIVGFISIVILRLTLEKEKRYYITNFLILPISLLCSLFLTVFEIYISLVFIVLIIAIAIIIIWNYGSSPTYTSEKMYYEYKTTDGKTLKHLSDDRYVDNTGKYYKLSEDGTKFTEM